MLNKCLILVRLAFLGRVVRKAPDMYKEGTWFIASSLEIHDSSFHLIENNEYTLCLHML